MIVKSFTSFPFIKPHFDKDRLFSQNPLFSISNIKIGYQALTYLTNIFTNHLTS